MQDDRQDKIEPISEPITNKVYVNRQVMVNISKFLYSKTKKNRKRVINAMNKHGFSEVNFTAEGQNFTFRNREVGFYEIKDAE